MEKNDESEKLDACFSDGLVEVSCLRQEVSDAATEFGDLRRELSDVLHRRKVLWQKVKDAEKAGALAERALQSAHADCERWVSREQSAQGSFTSAALFVDGQIDEKELLLLLQERSRRQSEELEAMCLRYVGLEAQMSRMAVPAVVHGNPGVSQPVSVNEQLLLPDLTDPRSQQDVLKMYGDLAQLSSQELPSGGALTERLAELDRLHAEMVAQRRHELLRNQVP